MNSATTKRINPEQPPKCSIYKIQTDVRSTQESYIIIAIHEHDRKETVILTSELALYDP